MARKKTFRNAGKFLLRMDRKANPKNEYPLYIQYTVDCKIAKGETGVWIQLKDWDDKNQRVRGSNPLHDKMNKLLFEKKLTIDTLILEYLNSHSNLNIGVLREMVLGTYDPYRTEDVDLVAFARKNLDYRYRTGKISITTRDNGYCAMHGFEKFLKQKMGRETLLFSELTETIVDDYIIWRREVIGNCNETINKTLTPLIKACHSASIQGLIPEQLADTISIKYLGEKKKLESEENDDSTCKHYLTEEQLKQLMTLYYDFKYPRTRDYVDMFMFSVYACGLRFSDIMTLQWKNVNMETHQLSKISVKSRVALNFVLNRAAMQILEQWKKRTGKHRFVFGLLPDDFDLNDDAEVKRQRINRNTPIKTSLRTIGEKMQLSFNLTMHVARHTWAVLALNKGVDVHKVSTLLGHSSVLVTEKVYAKFLPKTLDDEVLNKLDFDFS